MFIFIHSSFEAHGPEEEQDEESNQCECWYTHVRMDVDQRNSSIQYLLPSSQFRSTTRHF